RARVEALAVAHEPDPERLELVERCHEMAHTAREPIEAIDEHEIEGALTRAGHESIELGALLARAAHAVVDELGGDLEPTARGVLAQYVELHLRALARHGRDAGVDGGAGFHTSSSSV